MGEFEEREHAYEAKFAHDQELMFKARVRRDALAARWAVSKLGLTGAEADAYVQAIIALAVQKDHDQKLIRKLLADFEAAKVPMSEHRLRKHMLEFLEDTVSQVQSEVKG